MTTHRSTRKHKVAKAKKAPKAKKPAKAKKPKAGHFTVGTKEQFGSWRTHLTVV
jgi:hypothetical protein